MAIEQLSAENVERELASLPDWERDGDKIFCRFTFDDFVQAFGVGAFPIRLNACTVCPTFRVPDSTRPVRIRPTKGSAPRVVDGRSLQVEGHEEGFFLGGTLFDRVTPGMKISGALTGQYCSSGKNGTCRPIRPPETFVASIPADF